MTYVLYLLYKESTKENLHRKIFWNKVMTKITKICEKEYNEAKSAIKKIKPSTDYMDKLIDHSMEPIWKATKQSNEVKKIIKSVSTEFK